MMNMLWPIVIAMFVMTGCNTAPHTSDSLNSDSTEHVNSIGQSNSSALTANQVAELEGFDFSQDIAALDFISPRTASAPEVLAELGLFAVTAPINSPGDEKILGGLRLYDTGYLWTNFSPFSKVTPSIESTGNLPADGLALFPELQTQDGYIGFMTMDSKARLLQYYAGVNRFTGHFYRSFAPGNTEPGGMRLELYHQADDHWADNRGNSVSFVEPGKDGNAERDGAYHYTVLGDSGEALYDDMVSYQCDCKHH